MSQPLSYSRAARSWTAYSALGLTLAVWLGLCAIEAHPIVLVVAILPLILLAWELLKNDTSRFRLNDSCLTFGVGSVQTTVRLDRIDLVRLNRRLDLSWRVTIVLSDGQRLRVSPQCIPPIQTLDTALQERNIKIDRVLFTLAG